MKLETNIILKNYLTMNLGGPASFFTHVTTVDDIQAAVNYANQQHLPFFVIGGGSNIIARDEPYKGVIIHNQLQGFDVIDDTQSATTIKIAAGEIWDTVVERTVAMGLSGIEAMSAIPGTVGAAPVQNVGAYGQEIADTFVSLEAIDTTTNQLVSLSKTDCGFSYRHSIFRGSQQGRYVITSITLQLHKTTPQPPFYRALQTYLDEHAITNYDVQTIRDAVTAIRASKLPDPRKQPNTGSFFKNSIVDKPTLDALFLAYPDLPYFDMPNEQYKVPTGWLIDTAGLRGTLIHGMRVNPANALVLINESATSYNDLALARQSIITTIQNKFGIAIEQEPLELTN